MRSPTLRSTCLALFTAILLPALVEAGEWMTDFDDAKKIAAERNIPILVNFSGSDWCGWCIRLDKEVFSKEAFQAFAKKEVVLFLADFPRRTPLPEDVKKQNEALAQQFGVRGFPTILLLDADGELILRTGYKPGGPEAYIQHLRESMPESADADADAT